MSEVGSQAPHSQEKQTVAMLLRASGYTYDNIEELLGVPSNTARKWFSEKTNHHDLANKLNSLNQELQSKAQQILIRNIVSIAEKVVEIALKGDGNLQACNTIMDRVWGKPTEIKPDEAGNEIKKIEVEIFDRKENLCKTCKRSNGKVEDER